MNTKKLAKFVGLSISICAAVAAATGITLVVMTAFVTVGTVLALNVPYKPISILVELIALAVVGVLTVIGNRRKVD